MAKEAKPTVDNVSGESIVNSAFFFDYGILLN